MCIWLWDTYWHIIIYVYLTTYILYRHNDILFTVTWHVSTKFCIQFSEYASAWFFHVDVHVNRRVAHYIKLSFSIRKRRRTLQLGWKNGAKYTRSSIHDSVTKSKSCVTSLCEPEAIEDHVRFVCFDSIWFHWGESFGGQMWGSSEQHLIDFYPIEKHFLLSWKLQEYQSWAAE